MSEENQIKCPHCAMMIPAEAKVCPHCRKNVREKTGAYQLGTFLMAAALLGLVAGVFVDPVWCGGPAVIVLMIGYVIRKRA